MSCQIIESWFLLDKAEVRSGAGAPESIEGIVEDESSASVPRKWIMMKSWEVQVSKRIRTRLTPAEARPLLRLRALASVRSRQREEPRPTVDSEALS